MRTLTAVTSAGPEIHNPWRIMELAQKFIDALNVNAKKGLKGERSFPTGPASASDEFNTTDSTIHTHMSRSKPFDEFSSEVKS